jgi:hypothetical protein
MSYQMLSKWLGVQLIAALIALTPASGQSTTPYQPYSGQSGKDVVWIPTQDALVSQMLDMAAVTPDDFVIDLGSGDGRTVIAAAKRGARALGIEYEQGMVELSIQNAAKAGVSDKATFKRADLFESDFSQATVLTMFLLREINLKLRPKILDMKPGTRVVSNTFTMDDWEPDRTTEVSANDCRTFCKAYFWVVPAKVAGTWRSDNAVLSFEQKYQMVAGTMKSGSAVHPIKGRLTGAEITFTAGERTFTGRVAGNLIEGGTWRAIRD